LFQRFYGIFHVAGVLQRGVGSGGSLGGCLCIVGLVFRFGYPIYQIFDYLFQMVDLGPLVFVGSVLFHYVTLQSVNVLLHFYYTGR
jgi:hypothetical protein